MSARRPGPRRGLANGVTLIELMVALVLGLILTGAALTLFVTNRRTYVASESLGRVEETARTAFELMSRDVREAAGNPCDNRIPFDGAFNVLKNATTYKWWSSWNGGFTGYGATVAFADAAFGTGTGQRVSGTQALELKTMAATGSVLTADMPLTTSPITVNSTTGISAGDILGICEYGHLSGVSSIPAHGNIFQASSVGATITHTTTGTPGNADGSLAAAVYPGASSARVGGLISKYQASRWYIGVNSRGGRSLFQSSLQNTTGVPGDVTNEIAEGVDNMALKYLLKDGTGYVDSSAISATDWANVVAVQVTLTMSGQDKINGNALQRTLAHVITLRNRAP